MRQTIHPTRMPRPSSLTRGQWELEVVYAVLRRHRGACSRQMIDIRGPTDENRRRGIAAMPA